MPNRPAKHRPARRQEPLPRLSASARGYDTHWQRLRRVVLADEPLCRHCHAAGRIEPASEVDHILPLSKGGTNDRENLQPLCHRCHSFKTATEDGGFGH